MQTRSKITELTLYPALSGLLESYGFENISQVGVKHGYFDFECFYKGKKFIVEVKIGTGIYFKHLLHGITQAWEYCRDIKGDGILVIEYPPQIRTPLFLTPGIVRNLVTETKINAIFLSDFFNDSFSSVKPSEVFQRLQFSIDNFLVRKEVKTSFKLIIEALRIGIGTIAEILRSQRTKKEVSELIDTVVGRFDLFLGLGQIEKTKESMEKLKLTAIDLIPYLLSNQILFYHIFAETTGRINKLDEKRITSIRHLKGYFKKITDINYKAIYSIDLVSKLPDQREIVDEVKEIIKAMGILKPELVKHDLLGRLYHELLPHTTRKVLGAFYTNPVAADILAGLTIEEWDDTVMDTSCGSGTLLVSAYRRKLDLSRQEINNHFDLEKLHKKFVEDQITGIDIMPFASHLTAVNLSAQTPSVITDKVRVGCQDSLELQGRLHLSEFTTGEGTSIKPFRVPIQKVLLGLGEEETLDRSGVVSPEGEKGEEFLLKPVDVVLMNPPFSDREKMPKWYIKRLKDFKNLIRICGNQANLWSFFVALAHLSLKRDGNIGLVIPINIARGEATQQLRDFLIENYHIKYILKTTKDIAFSEGAMFRDILFIAEKKRPSKNDLTKIIFLKQSLKEIRLEDVPNLIEKIISKTGEKKYVDEEIEAYNVTQEELIAHKDNLMPLLWATNIKNMEVSNKFLDLIKKRASQKLIKIDKGWVKEGFHTSPKGLSKFVFITRNLGKSRIERALLVLEKDRMREVNFKVKDTEFKFKIDRTKIIPALRTGTAVNTLDISQKCDYLILDKFKDYKVLKSLLQQGDERDINWQAIKSEAEGKKTFVAISRRFRPNSPNTHLLSFYAAETFVPSDALKIITTKDKLDSQILCLSLNSILTLLQILMNRQQTTGGYADIRTSDLSLMNILNIDALSSNDRKVILNLFHVIKDVEFPSLCEQLKNRFPARVKLDRTILKILGFSDKEINEWLPRVYDVVLEELQAMKQ